MPSLDKAPLKANKKASPTTPSAGNLTQGVSHTGKHSAAEARPQLRGIHFQKKPNVKEATGLSTGQYEILWPAVAASMETGQNCGFPVLTIL